MPRLFMALLVVLFVAGNGCAAQRSERLIVFAAASLRDVVTQLAAVYENDHPGLDLDLSFDASSLLRAQVEAGAPADLFLSADDLQPRRLADAGLAAGEPVVFTHNRLALVVPADRPGHVRSWTDLGRRNVTLVAAESSVPISGYAEQLLANLAARTDAPSGFAAAVDANVASREVNVRAVLTRVELGEADAGVVYASDAQGDPHVRSLPLPADAQVDAAYAGVVLRGRHEPAATALLDWLAGPGAAASFDAHGFGGRG